MAWGFLALRMDSSMTIRCRLMIWAEAMRYIVTYCPLMLNACVSVGVSEM